ncbi:hypothetical protein [Virgisporangium aurantiacum]|uniref:Uncharacterized protein n=1 Tax=Virgisporangium aurantiacum TaxID=175570 RepID=A0A8J4E6J2_9ACTN|nr:hypothetical protein [Virgisporangium aurantiacum]GIJ60882.1 hypothetical protein Vau01_083980 [Virgisporangium aurantiacum]
MNISAGTSSATAARQGQPPARREDPVKAVADAQEVSRDDLFATIKSSQPAGGSPTAAANNQGRPQSQLNSPPPVPPPPGAPKGELSGLSTDDGKAAEISALLDTDVEEVRKVNSAAELVKMFQDRGVDLTSLRSVLNNGDLLDVAA